jgi:hypothetical protein
VHTVEFSRIGCIRGFAFLLGCGATFLTYLTFCNLSNRHAQKVFDEFQSIIFTGHANRPYSGSDFDWMRLEPGYRSDFHLLRFSPLALGNKENITGW